MKISTSFLRLLRYIHLHWRVMSRYRRAGALAACFVTFLVVAKLIHSGRSRPRRTRHFPFRTGCPQNCHPYRSDKVEEETEYYRITVEWYFGQPSEHNLSVPWSQQNGIPYDKGINFQCPESFVKTFQAAARELKDTAIQHFSNMNKGSFHIRPQKRMHTSLSYLCCLTSNEAEVALPIIDEWIDQNVFDFTLHFTDIQAWWESPNSVTNILLVDDASQDVMMQLNHFLNRQLTAAGVPIVIPREDQMPFHSTVVGFQYSDRSEDFDPQYEIQSSLPIIQDLVQQISAKYRTQWTPRLAGSTFRVTHKPMRSATPLSIHTQPLYDSRTAFGKKLHPVLPVHYFSWNP